MTELSDIPNEVLAKILEQLPPKDIQKATEICKRWCAVIDELVGVHKYIGRDTQMWPGENYEPLHTLGDFGVQNLVISDLSAVPELIPELRHPHLVRGVWVDEAARPSSLSKVLAPMLNLRSLIVHLSALGGFTFENFVLHLPSLTSFTISLYGIGQQQLQTDYFEDWKIPNILAILYNARLPSLKNLNLHLPLSMTLEEQLGSAVTTIISKHKLSLQKLLVNFEFTTRTATADGRPNLLDLVSLEYPVYDEAEAASMVTGLRLKKLFIHCARRNQEMMGVFHKIMQAQARTLQKLHVTTGYHQLPQEVLENNSASLTAVQLTVTTMDEEPLDLQCFRSCCNLKILTLVGPEKFGVAPIGPGRLSLHDVFSIQPDLIGVQPGLGPSLESVRIFNLYMASADADFIVGGNGEGEGEGLPALKLVSLHCIGTNGPLGLSLRSIGTILERKKILFFSIICGVNIASLTNHDIASQSPFACLAGLLLKSMQPCRFVLQLDQTTKTYSFGTQVNPSLPVSTDPKIIIDTEINIDFAIENDELFEPEEGEVGDEQMAAALNAMADDLDIGFGGEAEGGEVFSEDEDDEWDDEFQDEADFGEPEPNLPPPIGLLPLPLPLLDFPGFSEEENEDEGAEVENETPPEPEAETAAAADPGLGPQHEGEEEADGVGKESKDVGGGDQKAESGREDAEDEECNCAAWRASSSDCDK